MPPVTPKVIGVKCAAANVGEFIIVRNNTSGGQISLAVAGSGDQKGIVVNPSDDFTWSEGDDIQAEISGRIKGVITGKISKGGANLSIVASADTSVKSGYL